MSSVGHRLTVLKAVYEKKVQQNVPIEPDHYVPLCKPAKASLSSLDFFFTIADRLPHHDD